MKKILSILFLALSIASHGQLKIPFSTLPVATGNQDSTKFVALVKTGSVLANKVVYGIDLVKNYLKISDSSNMLAPYARAFNYYTKAESDARFTAGGGGVPSVSGQAGKYLSNNGTTSTWLYGPNHFINVKDYGGVADYTRVTDGSTTGSSSTVTSATAGFTAGDVGKTITLERTGSASADQVGTITAVTNSTTITVSFNCVLTKTNVKIYWGTDNTAAARAAIAAAAVGGIVRFPEGKWFVKDTLGIAKTLMIVGSGGAQLDMLNYGTNPNWTNNAATTIFTTTGTINLFSVNAINVMFQGLAIENNASDVTSGSQGIYFYHGQNFSLFHVSISGFYNNINMFEAYFWSLDHCLIDDPKNAGIVIRNTPLQDAGDWSIIFTNFYGGYRRGGGDYMVYQESSGGGKIANCKFNALLPNTPRYMYYGSISGTVDLQFANVSLENFDSSAIWVTSPGNFYNFTAYGLQIAAGRANTKDIVLTNVDNIAISAQHSAFDCTSQALVINGQKIFMANSTYAGYCGANAPPPYMTRYSNSIQHAIDVTNASTATSAKVGIHMSMTGAPDAGFFDYYPSNYDTVAYQNMVAIGTKVFGASVETRTGSTWQARKIGSTTPLIKAFSSGNIGVNAASDRAAAKFFIDATDAGWAGPRMTNAQINAIVSPFEGLQAFDLTNHTPVYFNGTTWVSPGGAGGTLTDGNKGHITVASSGSVWTINSGVVTPAMLSNTGTPSSFLYPDGGGAWSRPNSQSDFNSLVNDPPYWFSHMISLDGFQFASSGGAVNIEQTNGRIGLISLSTGTTATGRQNMWRGMSATTQSEISYGGGQMEIVGLVMFPNLSTSTDEFNAFFGFGGNPGNPTVNGSVLIGYDRANTGDFWVVRNADGGGPTSTTTSVAVVANQWYKLRIVVNAAATQVDYYIDGTLVATHTTHVPTSANTVAPAFSINKTVGTTSRKIMIDAYYEKFKLTTPVL
jgi:hypothetical protein